MNNYDEISKSATRLPNCCLLRNMSLSVAEFDEFLDWTYLGHVAEIMWYFDDVKIGILLEAKHEYFTAF